MSLVTADNLSVAFGKKVLLDDVSFALQPGERVGLIGPNGSGKSTLLRILAGAFEPDSGAVHFPRGVRAGYLPQDILELTPGPLVESVRSAVGDRDRTVAALNDVEEELAGVSHGGAAADADAAEYTLQLSQRLADLHTELADFEERYGRHRTEAILLGLGFSERDFDSPIEELSGGWKMRAALASLLLLGPDVLLLDEPTNHLDVPSLEWFDDFLRRSPKALLLISHDRDFLNRQIRRVLSFEPEGLRSYPGNYDSYRVQRTEEERNLELRARRQAAQRAETERFIERFRAKATKAKQVQSRVKQLEKEEVIQVRDERAKVAFRFPEVPRSGRDVVRFEDLQKRFGEKVIYRGLTKAIFRGERVAIIGVNGAGKTTLLKLLAGELAQDAGTITLGHNVTPAYYAQHHTELLDKRKTILEEIGGLVPTASQTYLRGVLGSFLFSGDDVDKRISVLSGGERARVALARLLVLPSNLLIMDEPTNHLDLDSSERLVEALKDYDGTLIFVSHNRSFINQLATKLWDVQGGDVVEWPGGGNLPVLDDYLDHLARIGKPMGGVARSHEASAPSAADAAVSDRDRRRQKARERESRAAETRPLKAAIASLETRIAALEAEEKVLEPQLADPALYLDFHKAQPLTTRFAALKAELETLYADWESKQEALAAAEASTG